MVAAQLHLSGFAADRETQVSARDDNSERYPVDHLIKKTYIIKQVNFYFYVYSNLKTETTDQRLQQLDAPGNLTEFEVFVWLMGLIDMTGPEHNDFHAETG